MEQSCCWWFGFLMSNNIPRYRLFNYTWSNTILHSGWISGSRQCYHYSLVVEALLILWLSLLLLSLSLSSIMVHNYVEISIIIIADVIERNPKSVVIGEWLVRAGIYKKQQDCICISSTCVSHNNCVTSWRGLIHTSVCSVIHLFPTTQCQQGSCPLQQMPQSSSTDIMLEVLRTKPVHMWSGGNSWTHSDLVFQWKFHSTEHW